MHKELQVMLGENSYSIYLGRGLLEKADTLLHLKRRALILSDEGVPKQYAKTLALQCENAEHLCLKQGEFTKSFEALQGVLSYMLNARFTRKDCIIALGGGVIGDLAGLASSLYMRGIDFYNIPTTTLSQIDSSIGGKTAINLNGVKNAVGTFYQPSGVLIDPDLLATLPRRELASGFAEGIKAGMIADAALFEIFERGEAESRLEDMLIRAIRVKQRIVETDEKEAGLRRILNFGHTIGHGIESAHALSGLLHGECVALGMLPMCKSAELRQRLKSVLQRNGLPTSVSFDPDHVFQAVSRDKKSDKDHMAIVIAEQVGKAAVHEIKTEELYRLIQKEAREGIGK